VYMLVYNKHLLFNIHGMNIKSNRKLYLLLNLNGSDSCASFSALTGHVDENIAKFVNILRTFYAKLWQKFLRCSETDVCRVHSPFYQIDIEGFISYIKGRKWHQVLNFIRCQIIRIMCGTLIAPSLLIFVATWASSGATLFQFPW